jgi:Leucine-rich repeat (LRR) protein
MNDIPEKEMREIMAIAMRMDSMKILCEVPFKDKTLAELDVSGKDLGMEGALVVAEYLDGNGAISSVNLLKNGIGTYQARTLANIFKGHSTLKSLCGNKGDEKELDMSGKMCGAGDVIMLAAEIVGYRDLSVLNLAENNLGELVLPEGWTEDYGEFEYEGLEVYKHTDGREQKDNPGKPEGSIAIANAIPDMRALTSLNLSSNDIGQLAQGALPDGWSEVKDPSSGKPYFFKTDTQQTQWEHPADKSPVGATTLANAISDMQALTSLDISNNQIGNGGAGQALGGMLKINTTLKTLNLSNNLIRLGSGTEAGKQRALAFAEGITAGLAGNETISSINLLTNYISVEQAQELVQIMQAKEKLITLCGLSKEETELAFSGQDLCAGDAVLIANDISDMGAMTNLDMSKNTCFYDTEARKVLGEMLAVNTVLKQLDLSNCNMRGESTKAFAVGIRDNRTLSVLSLKSTMLCAEGGKALAAGLKGNQGITELDISDNHLGQTLTDFSADTSGIIAIADAIPDMRAISVVNILTNRIPKEQAEDLIKTMKNKESLKTLCGIKPDQQEADFSGHGCCRPVGVVDAMLIANDISDKGALLSLDMSKNRLCNREAGKVLSQMLAVNTVLKEFDVSDNQCHGVRDGPGFAQELSAGIRDNGALTKLNISSNHIGAEQEQDLQRICVAGGIELAK